MESYCVSCKKILQNKILVLEELNKNKLVLVSNCAACGKKKSSLIKNQEVSGLFIKLGIRTSLSNIPLTVILF